MTPSLKQNLRDAALGLAFVSLAVGASRCHAQTAPIHTTDGYSWTAPSTPVTTYSMQWTFVPNQSALEADVRAQGIAVAEADGDPIMDNIRISRSAGYCKATIVAPGRRPDAAVMLHVQLHCLGYTHAAPAKAGPRGAGL